MSRGTAHTIGATIGIVAGAFLAQAIIGTHDYVASVGDSADRAFFIAVVWLGVRNEFKS